MTSSECIDVQGAVAETVNHRVTPQAHVQGVAAFLAKQLRVQDGNLIRGFSYLLVVGTSRRTMIVH